MARQTTVQLKEVQDHIQEVTRELAAQAEMLKDIVAGTSEELRGAAEEKLEEIARRSQAIVGKAKSRTKSEIALLEQKISEKSLQSALIAFAIGVLLCVLTRR